MYSKSKQLQPLILILGSFLLVKLVIVVQMTDTMQIDALSTEFEDITAMIRKCKFLIFMLGWFIFLNLFEKYMQLLPSFYFIPESSSAL